MKQFLGFFGVKENSISPFCRTFENANELRGAFMMYCSPSLQEHKQDEPSDDLGEKISDVAVENEMQNIETVKSLIAIVQKKTANAINDDEIVETGDHDTGDLDETEKDFPSLKFYNAVDGSTPLETFCDCLSCNKIEDISQLTYDGIFSLELKKRDQGSTSLERKSNLCSNLGSPKETHIVSKGKCQLRKRTKIHVWNVIH
eukprot:scaffold37745_cov27-Attheya_sp.AAC.1